MIILFVDLEDPKTKIKSLDAIKEIEKVYQKYHEYFGFFYADNN
jgi:hypothetical protein